MLREEFDNWAVLFSPDTGRGFGLNPTGVYVWKLLDGARTIGGLVKKIREHVDDLPENVSDHIGAFIDELVVQGLAGLESSLSGLVEDAGRATLCVLEQSRLPPEEAEGMKKCTYEPPGWSI